MTSNTMTSALVHEGPLTGDAVKHPAVALYKAMIDIYVSDQAEFARRINDFWTENFVFTRPDGVVVKGRDNALKDLQASVGFWDRTRHQPESFMVASDGKGGYDFFGSATSFFLLKGSQGTAEYVDSEGGKWDVAAPGAYKFKFVDTEAGLKFSNQQTFMDRLIVREVLMKAQGQK